MDDEYLPGIGDLLAPLQCETGGVQCSPLEFATHMSATRAAALLAGGANPFHGTRMSMIRMMDSLPGLGVGVVQLACEPISPANVHLFPAIDASCSGMPLPPNYPLPSTPILYPAISILCHRAVRTACASHRQPAKPAPALSV